MIKLVVDSSSCISPEFLKEHDIEMVHFNILINNEEFVEPDYPNYEQIYEILDKNKGVGKTSQPSMESYEKVFKKILNNGNEVICLSMGSVLSGASACAQMVANEVSPEKISVIDSGTVLQGIKILVDEALKLIDLGLSRAEIVEKLESFKKQIEIYFIPPSLDPLRRGGRIGTVSAIIGSVLNIKPILKFKDNLLVCYKKVMGMPKAIATLISEIPANCKKLYAIYVHKKDYMKNFVDQIKQHFPATEIVEGNVSATVGIHVGIGCIGYVFVR